MNLDFDFTWLTKKDRSDGRMAEKSGIAEVSWRYATVQFLKNYLNESVLVYRSIRCQTDQIPTKIDITLEN